MEIKVVKDTRGYFRLDPIPSKEEIVEFYRHKYFASMEVGKRASSMQKQKTGGEEAEIELEWLNRTLYSDILFILSALSFEVLKTLLDIGCGTGAFLKSLKGTGWFGVGVELSKEGTQIAVNLGVNVRNISLEDFAATKPGLFGAVTLLNVLEHVPDPLETLLITKSLLAPSGTICIRVPNDFSELQTCADEKLNAGKWWVASPDHINYFNFESLQELVELAGMEVVHRTTDFPMELFLLMGDDYVGNPEVGSQCHEKRRNFEMAIPDALRRKIYYNLPK